MKYVCRLHFKVTARYYRYKYNIHEDTEWALRARYRARETHEERRRERNIITEIKKKMKRQRNSFIKEIIAHNNTEKAK